MIMSAFLVEPSLYIVDEPFVGLRSVSNSITPSNDGSNEKSGAGILMSTHILATAERYCDSFIILHQGEVRAKGTLSELQSQFNMPGATLDDIYIALTKEEDYE